MGQVLSIPISTHERAMLEGGDGIIINNTANPTFSVFNFTLQISGPNSTLHSDVPESVDLTAEIAGGSVGSLVLFLVGGYVIYWR